MAASNATLASLWVDDAQCSPMTSVPSTPVKISVNHVNTVELKEDVLKYYRDAGLEPVAKEVGIIDINGDLAGFKDQNSQLTKAIQMISVPINSSGARSPLKMEQPHLLPKTVNANTILRTPQRVINAAHIITNSPRTPQLIATPIQAESPQWSRKRAHEFTDVDFLDGKRGKKGDKGGKGLRHFSMKVCEKVQKKGTTSYNEVADELVAEFSDPRNMSPSDQMIFSKAYDQKNIRRRVYDALNVLMAMNIISKEKKEIKWIGLPTNSAQECQNLEVEKQRRMERIKHKTQQLQELILQQISFKNLVQRNRELEKTQGPPTANSAIQLPFIIVNTSKKTVIDCSISNDKYEYLFNFDNTFEIHDDIEVLKRMGMAYGLEKGQCNVEDLKKAGKMIPKSLETYVLDLASTSSSCTSIAAGPSGIRTGNATGVAAPSRVKAMQSLLTQQLIQPVGHSLDSTDVEVAMALGHGLSRQSSLGSLSDMTPSRAATDTPSEAYSEESESDRSSPVDMS